MSLRALRWWLRCQWRRLRGECLCPAGTVATWHDARGRLMVGLRCHYCARLTGVHPAPKWMQRSAT